MNLQIGSGKISFINIVSLYFLIVCIEDYRRTKKKKVFIVSTNTRPVPLEHYLYANEDIFKIVDKSGTFLHPGYYYLYYYLFLSFILTCLVIRQLLSHLSRKKNPNLKTNLNKGEMFQLQYAVDE
jgi:hypothetical protein